MEIFVHKKLGFSLLVVLLMITPLASAFGVTTHYWGDNPLIMYPGQTKDIDVELQNMVGDEELTLQAEITEGSEIAALIDPDNAYVVPFGRKDIKVNIRVAVPENVALGEEYNIQVSFKQVAEEEGKMVQMAASVGTTIPVVIKSVEDVPVEQGETPKTGEKTSSAAVIMLAIVIIAIIIGYAIFKKKKKSKRY